MSKIPKLLDLTSFAEKGKGISGEFPLSSCDRLLDVVPKQDGLALVTLQFAKDGAFPVITGEVRADIELICQCCLDSLTVHLDCTVSLGLVRSIDAISRLPEGYEPLLIEGDDTVVKVADIIQDELILAIPQYPRHGHCALLQDKQPQVSNEQEIKSPFSILKGLGRD